MARTFVITDAAADSGFNVGSSGETAGDILVNREILEGGSGSGTGTADIGNDASDRERAVVAFQSDTGAPEPDDTSWEAGDYVININVTTARSGIQWRASYLMARTSGGSYTTVATELGQTTDLGSTGVKMQTINLASTFTANAGDTLYILLVFGGALQHGNSSVIITMGENIVTPLDAGTSPITATVPFAFGAPTVDLEGAGKLDAAAALLFAVASADLNAKGKLDATSALIFGAPSVDLKAKGKLDATAPLIFGAPVVDLQNSTPPAGAISAMAALVFGAPVVDIRATGKLDAIAPLVFASPGADLGAKGKLDAAAALVFGAPVVNLLDAAGVGPIAATVALAFAVSASLSGVGLLSASPALAFSLSSNLNDATAIGGPFTGRHLTPFVS